MPVGLWEPRSSRSVSSEAFMEDLCMNVGGYGSFFWTLVRHYFGWWLMVVIVPALFLNHHRCEVNYSLLAWLVYGSTLVAMLVMAVLLELSVVQRLGLLKGGDLQDIWHERQWQVLLAATVLWKLDSYTDIAFMFIARDCGSALWWASLATFAFVVIFGHLFMNTCCSCRDCERELPPSFGFVLLDFKLVNHAVKQVLPFDPDASDLPVARPVTLRTISHLISMQKIMGDVAQVSIQMIFYRSANAPHGFVVLSIFAGVLHGLLAFCTLVQECVQDEWATQSSGIHTGTALRPLDSAPRSAPPRREEMQQVQSSSAGVSPCASSLGRSAASRGSADAGGHAAGAPQPRGAAAAESRRQDRGGGPKGRSEVSLLADQDDEPVRDLLL